MLKWLGKLKWWRSKETGPIVYEYGRYLHKPTVIRTLSMVINISPEELFRIVEQDKVYLNDELIQVQQLAMHFRLESGHYEIKIPTNNKVWRFFII